MSGYQNVVIFGNVGREPETSYTQSGMAVATLSIATSKKKKDGSEETAWHRCKAFGKTAEIISQYVNKGDQILITEAELSYGKYDKNGVTHYTTDIIINRFQFVGGKKSGGQGQQQSYGQGGYGYQRAPQPGPQHQVNSSPAVNSAMNAFPGAQVQGQNPPNDDIPF